MTLHEQQAFHEKWIKGITLKMIWAALIIVLSIISAVGYAVWDVSNWCNSIEKKIENTHNDSKQFTKDQINGLRVEMNAKFDTVKINQISISYNTKLDIERAKSSLQKNKFKPQGLVTEVKKNGKIVFVPYTSQNSQNK